MTAIDFTFVSKAAGLIAMVLLAGCTTTQVTASVEKDAKVKTSAPIATPPKQVYTYTAADRECLKRAMYFESQRSSRDGLMAVGSVVMNRMTSGIYPETICGVVSQPKQFAPGVMTRKVHERAMPELDEAADAILRGERNPQVKEAMFFHTDGLKFPYDNMHYVTVAGGNAFYEKRGDDGELQTPSPKSADEYLLSYAPHMSSGVALVSMNDAAPASAQANIGSAPEIFTLPDVAPVPARKPQLASISSGPMMASQPQIWSEGARRPGAGLR